MPGRAGEMPLYLLWDAVDRRARRTRGGHSTSKRGIFAVLWHAHYTLR